MVSRTFFRAFRENFKQSFLVSLVLLAYFDNSFKNTVRNIVMMPLANPLLALLVTALDLLPFFLLLLSLEVFARCLIFWIAIGAALTAVAKMKLLDRLFRRFVVSGPEDAACGRLEEPDGDV